MLGVPAEFQREHVAGRMTSGNCLGMRRITEETSSAMQRRVQKGMIGHFPVSTTSSFGSVRDENTMIPAMWAPLEKRVAILHSRLHLWEGLLQRKYPQQSTSDPGTRLMDVGGPRRGLGLSRV